MADINALLAANRAAVDELMTAAEKAGSVWTVPRSPGKWSPSQVVEHVARVLEESANVVSGAPSKLPTLPAFLHPLIRVLFFNRVIRKGVFPNAKTNKPLNPINGPATPAEGRARLDAALAKFDRACRARVASGQPVFSAAFGRVSVEDYARFEELHTRHHREQIPAAS
jgi:hypothetical protein